MDIAEHGAHRSCGKHIGIIFGIGLGGQLTKIIMCSGYCNAGPNGKLRVCEVTVADSL